MRPAFTIIEVVAAAAIAAIAGVALLQMNSQSTFLFGRLSETSQVSETLSLVANHADRRLNKTTKSLYDLLGSAYRIENDELRKYLQNEKYDYFEHTVRTVSLGSDMTEEEEGEGLSEKELEDAAAAPVIQFELIQVGIRNDKVHGAMLTARPF